MSTFLLTSKPTMDKADLKIKKLFYKSVLEYHFASSSSLEDFSC
jgi:hypothetical protein